MTKQLFTKSQLIDAYWLEFIEAHTRPQGVDMAGKLSVEATDREFWTWFAMNKLQEVLQTKAAMTQDAKESEGTDEVAQEQEPEQTVES